MTKGSAAPTAGRVAFFTHALQVSAGNAEAHLGRAAKEATAVAVARVPKSTFTSAIPNYGQFSRNRVSMLMAHQQDTPMAMVQAQVVGPDLPGNLAAEAKVAGALEIVMAAQEVMQDFPSRAALITTNGIWV